MSVSRKGKTRKGRPLKCIENGIIYPSVKSAAQMLEISLNSLGAYLRGNLKSAQGFHFKYV
jgi:hypothetical protein